MCGAYCKMTLIFMSVLRRLDQKNNASYAKASKLTALHRPSSHEAAAAAALRNVRNCSERPLAAVTIALSNNFSRPRTACRRDGLLRNPCVITKTTPDK